MVDPKAAARAFGTTDATKSLADGLHDSTGEPFVVRLDGSGVTQSVVAGEKTGDATGALRGPKLPEKLACYRVLGRLGEGGMGIVYKGHDETLDRPVALKVLQRTRGADGAHAELEREARAIAAITHPHVVQVYAAGEQDGLAYFAMELVNGPDLREVLEREGPLSVARAKRYMGQAVLGLRAAARKGIFHRDVKPANLLLDSREDQVKVADFGLAKRACVDASMGGTSLIAGTPLYVAPEVIREGSGDHRADIYSLGSTFFHLLSGQPPFGGKTAADALVGHATAPAPDVRSVRPDVPAAFAALIRRCMEKDPAHRFQSYDELLAELEMKAGSTSDAGVSLHVAPRSVAAAAPIVVAVAPPAPPPPPMPPAPPPLPSWRALPPVPPVPPVRPVRSKATRWPFIVAIVAVVAGTNVLGLRPSLKRSAHQPPRPEALADCGFASFVQELTRLSPYQSTPGTLFAPTTASTANGRLTFNAGRRGDYCPESSLLYAVCGRGATSPILTWHVHDVDDRIVEYADQEGSIHEMQLEAFLRYLKALAVDPRHGGRRWPDVVRTIRAFLPGDAHRELDKLDERND